MQEVEALIRAKQEEMERSTLTIKEEKQRLLEMKRMKDDARQAAEWESDFEDVRNKRSSLTESLRAVFADLDAARDASSRAEAAVELGLSPEAVVERKLSPSAELRELLSSAWMRKRLRAEYAVVVRSDRAAKAVRVFGEPEGVEAAGAFVAGMGPVGVARIKVDEENLSLLIGRKGATVEALQEESGCSVELRRKELTVVLAGPAEAVVALEARIEHLLLTQRRVELKLSYDPEQKGRLLGKGGATVQRIQSQSGGATLDIGKGDDATVRVSGPAHAVETARVAISRLLSLDAESVRTVAVPEAVALAVLGRGTERLKLPEGVCADRAGDGAVKVRGSRAAVEEVVREIEAAVAANERVEETLEVESQHVSMLLGKGGQAMFAMQKETGANIALSKQADGKVMQTATIKGTRRAVGKALAALEAVLQYNADCSEKIEVKVEFMPFVIGKGGEEINRIRAATGAAIDAARNQHGNEIFIRGSAEAVEAAKRAISAVEDANRRVTESVPMPWHCIDLLLGPNAERLRQLEAEHSVQLELPGVSLASDVPVRTTFLGISSSMSIRGRRKHVEAAMAEVTALSRKHQREETVLLEEDAELLSRACLQDEGLLPGLEARFGVSILFEPLSNRIVFRGEGYLAAQIEVQHLLSQWRPSEAALDCPPFQMALLHRREGGLLLQLQCLVAPALLALQECPSMVLLTAAAPVLSGARAKAEAWIQEHAECSREVQVPPEVAAILSPRLRMLAAQHQVDLEMRGSAVAVHGPEVCVAGVQAELKELIEQHAITEVSVALVEPELSLVELHARAIRASHLGPKGGSQSKGGSQPGISIDVRRSEGLVVLRGTRKPIAAAQGEVAALLEEARSCAHHEELSVVQMERLLRPASRAAGAEPFYRKLQESHHAVLHLDRVGRTLTLFGLPAAVQSVQQALASALDVCEERRQVALATIPIIIGRAGANIKRLQQESGASFDIDRNAGHVRVYGSKAAVAAAVAALDALLVEHGGSSELPVKAKQVPLIIGRGGATIRQLESDSGATITVSKDDGVVRVRGSKRAVDKATELLQQLLSGGGANGAKGANGTKDAHGANGQNGANDNGAAVRGAEPPPGLTSAAPARRAVA